MSHGLTASAGLIATLLAADAGALAAQQATRPAPAGTLRVQKVEIMDRQGFEKPLVAATILVPVGWKGEGGVEWTPLDPCGDGHRFNWKATAPDGIGAIQLVPAEKWSAGSFPMPENKCLMAPVAAARAYLEWYAQRNRPGARVLDYRPRPDLAAPFASLANTTPMQGGEMRSWVEGGELLIGYTVRGKPVREAISTVGFFIQTRMAGMGGGPGFELLQGQTFTGFAMRAPEGALDFKMADALRQSMRAGPEWNARMVQSSNERHRIAMESNRQIAETNRRAAAERSEIIARTGREISEMQMEGYRASSESQDRAQRERIETIRGVETYNDPRSGGTVQLPNQYEHAWQLRDGTFLLTDDVNFDPSRDLGVQGQRLKKAQR